MAKMHYWYGPCDMDLYYDTPNGTANYVGRDRDAYNNYGISKKLKYIGEFLDEEVVFHPNTIKDKELNFLDECNNEQEAMNLLVSLRDDLIRRLNGEGCNIYPGPVSTEFTEYDKMNLKFFHIDI